MSKFDESNFYKALQDFFINNNKETFLQMLSEFYNRTEGIIIKNEIQDELIKELRELCLENINKHGINIMNNSENTDDNESSSDIIQIKDKNNNILFKVSCDGKILFMRDSGDGTLKAIRVTNGKITIT